MFQHLSTNGFNEPVSSMKFLWMNKSWFSNTEDDCLEKLNSPLGQEVDSYEGPYKEAIVHRARGVGQRGQFSRVGPRDRWRRGVDW